MDKEIVGGVINGMKEGFEGLDENILEKLEKLWIAKLEMTPCGPVKEENDPAVDIIEDDLDKITEKVDKSASIVQLDGPAETSDEDSNDDDEINIDEDDDDDEYDDTDDEFDPDGERYDTGIDLEPLNSDDDIQEEDPTDVFDTENIVVCQFEKIKRARNLWKLYLKNGVMNLNGRDYVFKQASGEVQW